MSTLVLALPIAAAPVAAWAQVPLRNAVPATVAPARSADGVAAPELDTVARLVVDELNRFRLAQGLAAVAVDARLVAASQALAELMAASGRFGHAADGRDPGERALAQGYGFCLIAENMAYRSDPAGFSSAALAQALSAGWQNSPPHRDNLLAGEATDTGFGIALGDQGRYFAVQLMARPASGCRRRGGTATAAWR